ncbi:MAG TPA: copper homeostasis protein CutC [Gemmatimonadales bacterium]
MILEACVDSIDAGLQAHYGGADRIELCSALDVGGLAPDSSALRQLLALDVVAYPMVRPRGGSFVFRPAETDRMAEALRAFTDAGARGAVIGGLTDGGLVDRSLVQSLRAVAGPGVRLTFHKAFDEITDQIEALEALIDLGVDRVLTSGGAATAWEGRDRIAVLVERARERIVIMAGGKVTPENSAQLVAATGVRELHFRTTDAAKVNAIRASVAAHDTSP